MSDNIFVGDILHIETKDGKRFDGVLLKFSKVVNVFYMNILRKYKNFQVDNSTQSMSYPYVRNFDNFIICNFDDCEKISLVSSAKKSSGKFSKKVKSSDGENNLNMSIEEDIVTFYEHYAPYRITSCIIYTEDLIDGFWGHSFESNYGDAKLLSYKDAKQVSLKYNNIIKDVIV